MKNMKHKHTKTLLENLIDVGYTAKEISKYTDISEQSLSKILNDKVATPNANTRRKIEDLFNKSTKEVDIGDLENYNKAYLIDTPDGWQKTGEFFNKGILKCYKVTTEDGNSIIASAKHLLQLERNLEWSAVDELTVGDVILSTRTPTKVISVKEVGDIDCVDIEVLHENHRYYCENLVSHNSGKSFLAAQVAANALNEQDYDVIFYFDSEGGAMQEFFINRGCDTTKIEQVLVESVEDSVVKILSTYKQIEEFKEKDPTFKALFILDSLGALVANKFINDAAAGKVVSDMGGRAKICNNLVKACTIPALKTDTSLIIVNHTYDDPSSMFTSKIKAQGGGKGLQFMARINLQCSKVLEKEDKGKKPENYYKATILKFFTAKNSIVKPFYQSVMYLDFSKGPHKYFGLVEPAKEYGFITSPTQGFYVVPSYSEKKFRMKALLDCPEAWESFLPEFDKRSQEELAYSGEVEDEMSDEFLEEAALDDTSSDEEADIEVT